MSLSIDVRMLKHSGIGTYIKNLLPLVIAAFPERQINLLGNRNKLLQYSWSSSPNVRIIDCLAPIYSLAEQIELAGKIPRDTRLFWSPHYNIPVFYGGKLLVTVHDVFHLAMQQFVGGIHKKIYAKAMFWQLTKQADAVLCDSLFTKQELQRCTGIGESKTRTVYLGVDEQWFSVSKESRVNLRKYLLYVGNVKPHKNLANFLLAFSKIKEMLQEYDIIIVGKKEGFITGDTSIDKLAQVLGNRVSFTGYISEQALLQYYANAEALVFPSLYEGFGLPPLEAMACGCPVIVAETASLPEICGDAALYVDPYNIDDIGNKILLLLNQPGLRQSLQTNGLRQARQYTWKKCAHETCSVIADLLGH